MLPHFVLMLLTRVGLLLSQMLSLALPSYGAGLGYCYLTTNCTGTSTFIQGTLNQVKTLSDGDGCQSWKIYQPYGFVCQNGCANCSSNSENTMCLCCGWHNWCPSNETRLQGGPLRLSIGDGRSE
ncbi:hypothetical protein BDZ90DRAFT_234526 [Jaminaea rosea]|uniref:Uncharacterized protein n=1 Tax=Jaminaea rosea TaxID=1569628 RepID=A0A316UHZ4_9BASI|nr:hypothetical protein BDZ90DRAFT_234526 [Jaminaea rosea]PWN24916.1 hypothetical protein BDZ90DRAFT_234526 [Jaminaea rosea]